MHSPASKKLKTMDEDNHFSAVNIKKEEEDDDSYEGDNNENFLLDKKEDYNTIFNKVSQNICEIKNANRDIDQLFAQVHEKYTEIADKFEKVELQMKRMEELKEEEKLQCQNPPKECENDLNSTFSSTAKGFINASSGPLNPDELCEFLDDKVLDSKPKSVLPLVRNYTSDIKELVVQLQKLRNHVEDSHEKYKEQRKLDVNITRKIDRLLPKILFEYESELKSGKRQTSINEFTRNSNST